MALKNPKPWHRGEGESVPAYEAFLAYARLGPGRTVTAAWRSLTGAVGVGRRPPRCWGTWADAHDWGARARAYDERYAAGEARRKTRSWRVPSRVWFLRRERQNEREYRFGLRLWRRANAMLDESKPVRVPGRLKDNVVPQTREFGPIELKRLQEVGDLAGAMIRDACTRSIPQESVVPGLSVAQLSKTPEIRQRAEKGIEAWRAEQTPAVVAFLNSKNPLDSPPDPPTTTNGQPNSASASGTPPTSATGTA